MENFTNSTNATFDCTDTDDSDHTLIYVMYSIIFVISLFGNSIVCYIVIWSPRMRTVTNYFIMNLAIGDILITILCIPFTAYSYTLQHWPFDAALCPIVNYSQAVSVFVSSYTLVAISIDRYLAIMWPLRPRLSKKSSGFIIFTVWFVASVTVLPILLLSRLVQPQNATWMEACDLYICKEQWDGIVQGYGETYSKALLILQYVIPLAVLVFTYTSIAITIWCHRIPGEAENSRDKRIAKSKMKIIKMMITVVVVYTICWLPYNIFWIIVENYNITDRNLIEFLFYATHWFAMSHTCYNPLIYCYMNVRFRLGIVQALRSIPCVQRCCTPLSMMRQGTTSFPLTSAEGTDSTILHRNNTCTTYISTRRKNGSRFPSPNAHAPARSASVMRSDNSGNVVRRYHNPNSVMENEI